MCKIAYFVCMSYKNAILRTQCMKNNCLEYRNLKERKRIESFRMWYYRRILGIKWTKIRNKKVLVRIGGRMYLWSGSKRRTDKLNASNERYLGILILLSEEKVEGKYWVS